MNLDLDVLVFNAREQYNKRVCLIYAAGGKQMIRFKKTAYNYDNVRASLFVCLNEDGCICHVSHYSLLGL